MRFSISAFCSSPKAWILSDLFFSKDSKIFFLEAIAYRSHPISKAIFEILSNNNFVKIEKIKTSFGFDTKRIKPGKSL